MLEGHDIICFCNDWDGDPLSKKHIMQRMARRNRVLWVNSIGNRNPTATVRDFKRIVNKLGKFLGGLRRVEQNLWVFSPLALPFHGNAAARRINRFCLSASLRRACRRLGFRNPITWSFVPSSGDVVGTLGEKFIVYHCVDEYSEFSGTDKAAILELERRLIEKSDVVFVSSGPLEQSKRRLNPCTFLVTHGVDVEHFRRACAPETAVPAEIASLPRPVVGFYGLIADWVDLALVRKMALARPQWSFVLIGKLDTDPAPVAGLPNVHLPGRKSYGDLPAWCKGMDVAISPFVINELTLAANPLKLREYLAAGLPAVSTALPEAERIGGYLRVGKSDDDFLYQVESLLAERTNGSGGPQLAISRSMDNESWDAKVEELSRIVAGLMAARAARGPAQAGAFATPTGAFHE